MSHSKSVDLPTGARVPVVSAEPSANGSLI